jgi:hypothetical protein
MPGCTGISPTTRSAVCSVSLNSIVPWIFMSAPPSAHLPLGRREPVRQLDHLERVAFRVAVQGDRAETLVVRRRYARCRACLRPAEVFRRMYAE